MKYIVVLGDGMADYPVEELGGRTPLQAAHKPWMDFLAQKGETGMVKTIPDNMPPGSDVANLSVLGYDPLKYYTGRSPLEAVSMGIDLGQNDTAFRCNLVTLSDDDNYEEKTMVDYSSDEISTEEARHLIEVVNNTLGQQDIRFYPGLSYRHCMVWKNAPDSFEPSPLTPPHDILEKRIGQYLPRGNNGSKLLALMKKSWDILSAEPLNLERRKKGLNPANSIWLWGEGKKPSLPLFKDLYGCDGAVITAVDLIKGIGICAGLKCVHVDGATGNINTNYTGKCEAAINELKNGKDFVYIHLEAPDECGHRHEIYNKVKSIEYIDKLVLGPLVERMPEIGDFSIMVLPDHPTPLSLRTHTAEPVPYVIYRSTEKKDGVARYDEQTCRQTGNFIENGQLLMNRFLKRQ